MDEFALIHRVFKPLAAGFSGSLNLTDDAAIVEPPAGTKLVISKDALVSGVHFFGQEDAALIARKLLRANLSDIAAMGARPLCYFLGLSLPQDMSSAWVERFGEGLAQDQEAYHFPLAGGDTTRTPGPLTLSITAVGYVTIGQALRRSRAQAGDALYVSGTIGDAALGLRVMRGELTEDAHLRERYLLPQPRVELGARLHGIVSSCMDISDGLAQDLGHICAASNVAAVLEAHRVPLSPSAARIVESQPQHLHTILSGGDDYELLFTVPSAQEAALKEAAKAAHTPVTRIGHIAQGSGVKVLDAQGSPIALKRGGFNHFS